ncbi:MAG: hypothetical protein DMG06_01520 [Acidobacteria bacterium]|nr:MAG: hypothetical protein DMG06_01520 [Acidobacteriota bacterium]
MMKKIRRFFMLVRVRLFRSSHRERKNLAKRCQMPWCRRFERNRNGGEMADSMAEKKPKWIKTARWIYWTVTLLVVVGTSRRCLS